MSPTLTIRRAAPSDVPAVAGILADAFAADPVGQWIWPDDGLRPSLSRHWFLLFAEMTVGAGDVFIAGADEAAALWLPVDPADQHDDAEFSDALAAASGPFAERFRTFDRMMAAVHPLHEAHSYLPLIGVVPGAQGRGLGAALLAARNRDLDAASLPAYLEASTYRSSKLYEKHGYEYHGSPITLPDGPSLYPMWRPARSR
jgi:ribosomal protein S18 acetylase RimI-like enzyme